MSVMRATVLQCEENRLLVRDHFTGQEVLVNTPRAHCFSVGDRVRILHTGIMTMSLPPQITAIRIFSCR